MVTFDFNKYVNLRFEKLNLDALTNLMIKDNNMMGWFDLDSRYIEDIKETANQIKEKSDVFLIIGAGGSINCSKAIIDAFKPHFKKKKPEIIYLGDSLSSDYLLELLEYIKNKKVFVNIISKSANTLEVNLATDIIMYLLNKKYSKEELKDRVIITTENVDNTLTRLAREYGFKRYVIEKEIGGRYSMFTPASLLPMAVAGINLELFFLGAKEAKDNLSDCYKYVLYRYNMYLSNLVVEAYNVYDPKLKSFLEWVKQLFAESQGKNGRGILPIANINTGDLHSMGQFMQDGLNIVFETNIYNHSIKDTKITKYNKTMDDINYIALKSVAKSHFENNKNGIIIEMDKIDELNLGYLAYFFMLSAALGGYLLNVNYYDQEGVNNYKKIMLEELSK